MKALPTEVEISDVPAHVQAWSAARLSGFVPAVLSRWQREHGELPERLHLVICPQVEINARGGLPPEVHAITDPRLTCRQFTGCHKPYFVALFEGGQGAQRSRDAQQRLAWSEAYAVAIAPSVIRLSLIGYTEDLDEDDETPEASRRSLRELLRSGELMRILE